MALAVERLPGVTFDVAPPEPEEALPRMDVAAFVGFASAGPLDIPVVVDSPAGFRDLFGPDPELAWDSDRGEQRRAHLGAAIEAFFANGGLRCWAVRVADRGTAVRHRFALPGLIDADDRFASPTIPAEARARSVGTFVEGLAIGTALHRDPLPLLDTSDDGPLGLAANEYRFDLVIDPQRVQMGDLLEVVVAPGEPVLLLFVDSVVPIAGGVRVLGSRRDNLSTGETDGTYWIEPRTGSFGSPPGSPDVPSDGDPEAFPPLGLAEADGLAAAAAVLGSPPTVALLPSVRRLSFELLVWRESELEARLEGLTFDSRHPRFWADLPDDETLFETSAVDGTPAAAAGLALEASRPRFPLAGPVVDEAAAHYLPWGMGRARTVETALPLAGEAIEGNALERDGLAVFSADLFLDRRLTDHAAGALLAEAEYQRHVRGRALAGFHCLLPVVEVSLIAIPDAVHRGWSRELPPSEGPTPLAAPWLDPIPDPDVANRYLFAWTTVEGATRYRLERSDDPTFEVTVTAFDDSGTPSDAASAGSPDRVETRIVVPLTCPKEQWFRVRAFRDGEAGPWSNTRGARLPSEPFVPCEGRLPGSFVLSFVVGGSPDDAALFWDPLDPSDPPADTLEIVTAADAGFLTAIDYSPDGMTTDQAPVRSRRVSPRYYRIRGISDGSPGPWSNTVLILATERGGFTEPASESYDHDDLLAVHRSLLRFAAARADLVALLSLPGHYRDNEARRHVGSLTAGGSDPLAGTVPGSPAVVVRPLTYGESGVLSYGALYHPWIIARVGDDHGSAPLRRLPPDGAVAGTMAFLAVQQGAWHAPANRPFSGVVALDPELGRESWKQLLPAGVNTLLHDPHGFLALSEDTLSSDRSLGRIHVRRLLILLRRLALREGRRYVFEPNSADFRHRVRHRFERMLGQLFERGAFAGDDPAAAFRVVTDDSVNPPEAIDRGRFTVELRVAPAASLTHVTVRLTTAGPGRLAVEEV